MPDALYNLREKYPQYNDLDDRTLATMVVKKYPQYRDALGSYLQATGAPEPLPQVPQGAPQPQGQSQSFTPSYPGESPGDNPQASAAKPPSPEELRRQQSTQVFTEVMRGMGYEAPDPMAEQPRADWQAEQKRRPDALTQRGMGAAEMANERMAREGIVDSLPSADPRPGGIPLEELPEEQRKADPRYAEQQQRQSRQARMDAIRQTLQRGYVEPADRTSQRDRQYANDVNANWPHYERGYREELDRLQQQEDADRVKRGLLPQKLVAELARLQQEKLDQQYAERGMVNRAATAGGRALNTVIDMPAEAYKGISVAGVAAAQKLQDMTGVDLSGIVNMNYRPENDTLYRLLQGASDDAPGRSDAFAEANPDFVGRGWDNFGNLVGQLAGFTIGGGALSTAKIGEGMAAALMGFGASAAASYDEALAAGADEQTARNVALLNGVAGTSEGLPVGQIFARFRSTRRLVETLEDAGMGGLVQRIFREGAKGALEEGGQEVFQQLAGNAVARAYYDENRDWIDGVVESGSIGGGIGFLFNAMAVAFGGKAGRAGRQTAEPQQPASGPTMPQDRTQAQTPSEATLTAETQASPTQPAVTGQSAEPTDQLTQRLLDAGLTESQIADLTPEQVDAALAEAEATAPATPTPPAEPDNARLRSAEQLKQEFPAATEAEIRSLMDQMANLKAKEQTNAEAVREDAGLADAQGGERGRGAEPSRGEVRRAGQDEGGAQPQGEGAEVVQVEPAAQPTETAKEGTQKRASVGESAQQEPELTRAAKPDEPVTYRNANATGFADGEAGRPPRTQADMPSAEAWEPYAYGYSAGSQTRERSVGKQEATNAPQQPQPASEMTFAELRSEAKRLGVDATGKRSDIARRVDTIRKPLNEWTDEDLSAVQDGLVMHQDLREDTGSRVDSIMRNGLRGGMSDQLGDFIDGKPTRTWAGQINPGHVYLVQPRLAKYQKESARFAEGTQPFAVIRIDHPIKKGDRAAFLRALNESGIKREDYQNAPQPAPSTNAQADVPAEQRAVDQGGEPQPVEQAGQAGAEGAEVPAGDLTQRLAKIEQDAINRLKNIQLKGKGRYKGGSVIGPVLKELSIIVAARAARLGVNGAKAISELVETVAKELGAKLSAADKVRVYREASRIERRSRAGKGRKHFDVDLFENAAADLMSRTGGKQPTTKQTIRAATEGGTDTAKTISQRQALKASLKSAERVSKIAFKAGHKEALAKITEQVKAKTATTIGIRKALTAYVKEYLPSDLQGRMLAQVRDANTYGKLAKGIRTIRSLRADRALRGALMAGKPYAAKRMALNLHNSRRGAWNALLSEAAAIAQEAKDATAETLKAIPKASDLPALRRATRDAGIDLPANATAAQMRRALRDRIIAGRIMTNSQAATRINEIHQKLRDLIKQDRQARIDQVIIPNQTEAAKGRAQIHESLSKLPDAPQPERRKGGILRARKPRLIRRGLRALPTPENAFDAMGEDVRRIAVDKTFAAENAVALAEKADLDALHSILNSAGIKPDSNEARSLSHLLTDDYQTVKIKLDSGKTMTLTPAQLIDLNGLLSDSNRRSQVLGSKRRKPRAITFDSARREPGFILTQNDVATIAGANEAMAKIAKAAGEHFRSKGKALDNVSWRLRGRGIELSEDYYPSSANLQQSPQRGTPQGMKDQLLPQSAREHIRKMLENVGILQEREANASTPLLVRDFFQRWHEYNRFANLVEHQAENIRIIGMMTERPQTLRLISNKMGEGQIDYLRRYQGELAGTQRSDAGVFRALARNVASSLIAGNVKSWGKNLLGGMSSLLSEFQASDWLAGLKGITDGKINDRLTTESGYFYRRHLSEPDRVFATLGYDQGGTLTPAPLATRYVFKNLVTDIAKRRGKRALADVKELTAKIRGMTYADKLIARVAYHAAASEISGQHPKWTAEQIHKAAVARAELAFFRTQNGNQATETPPWLDTLRRHGIGQLYGMFKSEPSKQMNYLLWGARKGHFRRSLTAAAMNWAISASIDTTWKWGPLALAAWLGYNKFTDDDEEKAIGTAALSVARNVTQLVPFGDTAVDLARNISTGQDAGDAIRSIPDDVATAALNGIADMVKGIHQAIQDQMAGDTETYASGKNKGRAKSVVQIERGAERLMVSVSEMLGLPLGPAYWQGKNIAKSFSPDVRGDVRQLNEERLALKRKVDAGNASQTEKSRYRRLRKISAKIAELDAAKKDGTITDDRYNEALDKLIEIAEPSN